MLLPLLGGLLTKNVFSVDSPLLDEVDGDGSFFEGVLVLSGLVGGVELSTFF